MRVSAFTSIFKCTHKELYIELTSPKFPSRTRYKASLAVSRPAGGIRQAPRTSVISGGVKPDE